MCACVRGIICCTLCAAVAVAVACVAVFAVCCSVCLLYLNETRRLGWHSDRCTLIGVFSVSRQSTLLLKGAY